VTRFKPFHEKKFPDEMDVLDVSPGFLDCRSTSSSFLLILSKEPL